MNKLIQASALLTLIVAAAGWAGWILHAGRPHRPVPGLIHRSKVDRGGHTRGIVQVDLMRQIMADRARATRVTSAPACESRHKLPSQNHPLLNRPAPLFVMRDAWGRTWDLSAEVHKGPVVLVFYLGATCMACVTHLTELDAALERFGARGASVVAVSGDAPEFSLERMHKYGEFQIPFLCDADRATSLAYGVWKAGPGKGVSDGEAQHGTFVVDRDGLVRWAHVGERPFTDIEAIMAEIDALKTSAPIQERSATSPER